MPQIIRDGGPGAHTGDNNGPTAANSAAAISQLNAPLARWLCQLGPQHLAQTGPGGHRQPANHPGQRKNHISRSAWPSPTPTSTLTPDIATHQAFWFSPGTARRARPDCASALSSSSAHRRQGNARGQIQQIPGPAYGKAPPSHGQPRHSCCKPAPDSQTINT